MPYTQSYKVSMLWVMLQVHAEKPWFLSDSKAESFVLFSHPCHTFNVGFLVSCCSHWGSQKSSRLYYKENCKVLGFIWIFCLRTDLHMLLNGQILIQRLVILIMISVSVSRFSVNDIVVLGPEQFYATRDHYFTTHFLSLLEIFLELRWTYVLFYSPKEVKVVARGFNSANGITASQDKKYAFFLQFWPFALNILVGSHL